MSIGEVLGALRPEFPDVTISKLRFLESEGLVEPARTPSGYRKFSHADVERLRYVLEAQRDHYLPLRVIKEHLDALDRGLELPEQPGGRPQVPRAVIASPEGSTEGVDSHAFAPTPGAGKARAWGFPTVPIPVRDACVLTVGASLRRDVAALAMAAVGGDLTDIQPDMPANFAIPPAARRKLAPFRRNAGIF